MGNHSNSPSPTTSTSARRSGGYMIPRKSGSDTSSSGSTSSTRYTKSGGGYMKPRKSGYGGGYSIPKKSWDGPQRQDRSMSRDNRSMSRDNRSMSRDNTCYQRDDRSYQRDDRSYKREPPLPIFVSTQGGFEGPGWVVVDHPIFDGVKGFHKPLDFEDFYTDDVHRRVVDLMASKDEEFSKKWAEIDRVWMHESDVRWKKHSTLTEFFWMKGVGHREPRAGEMFRGTIMMEAIY